MSANSDQLAKFLKAHRDFKLSGNKVRCESTGHELVADVEAIKKYMSGKKYKKLAQWYSYDFNKYKSNYIYPGRTPKTMYCQVTKMTLNKIPSEIENHIRGKKYKSALATYEARLERTKQANLKKQKEWGNNKKTHVAPVADPNMMTDIAEAPEDGVDFGLLSRIVGEDKNEESEDDMEDLIPGFKKNAGDDEDDDDMEDDMEDVLEDVVEDEIMESDEIEAEDVDEDEVSAEEELMDEDSIEDLIALPSYDVSETYNRVIDMLSERAMEKKKQKAAAKEQEASKKKQLEKVSRTKKVDLDARKEKESKSKKKEKDSKKDKESSKKDKKSKKDKQSSVEEQEEKKQEQKTDKKSKKPESSKTESNKSKSTKMDSDSDSDQIPELIPIVEMKFAGFPVKKSKEQQKKSHGAQANQKSKPNWDAGLQPSRKAPKNQKMDTTQSKVKSSKKK